MTNSPEKTNTAEAPGLTVECESLTEQRAASISADTATSAITILDQSDGIPIAEHAQLRPQFEEWLDQFHPRARNRLAIFGTKPLGTLWSKKDLRTALRNKPNTVIQLINRLNLKESAPFRIATEKFHTPGEPLKSAQQTGYKLVFIQE
ncbi:hypothetical protein COV82_01925 [Candidatus Peregrinibacteria bacterium CG11_big_fil_rev_8_21_14_0_20_46_8]|nr:MAG: hypothetical protein COV82_01925 [Candidatus Peregrinibacteria bacterium CG11_big_fil_rev_8_21_14_0_20_46_8]